MRQLRTAESVSPKHPDKLCDQISDAVLDEYLAGDPTARVAVEVVGGHDKIFVTGEVSSQVEVAIDPIVHRLAGNMEVEVRITQQSPEIAKGVDIGGAGDQGIMIGYATRQTPERLPLEVVLARRLNQYLYRHWPYDGKTQVTIDENNELVAIVASFQHVSRAELTAAVKAWAGSQDYVNPCFVKYRNTNPTLHINPAGDWQIGGFAADAGLTGRKLVADNYGPGVPIGGGCYSGKDPSKVDRSGAYMARLIALEYLERFRAEEAYVRLAYAIGHDQPVEATAIVDGVWRLVEGYDLSPRGIIARLNLARPQYEVTARYGHFGHSEFAWERTGD